MKILISASKVVEVEIPEGIDSEDVDDFVVGEIRDNFLGSNIFDLDGWVLIGWEKVQKEEAIA